MSLHGNIFLIGLPGCGKSTVGRQLADLLDLSFIDLDAEIEKNAGLSIKEIFSKSGEDHFRQLEREALLKVVESTSDSIVATGGGTPCFFDNMDVIERNGVSVFIDTPHADLVSRLSAAEKEKRPKFSDTEKLSDTLSKLRQERMSFYSRANYRWVCTEQSIDDLITMITSPDQ